MTSNRSLHGCALTSFQAEAIVADLQREGFELSDISVVFPEAAPTHELVHEESSKAPEGAVAGVTAGGAVGGTLGLLLGLGALAIPGFGALLAAGPILSALSGAATGAAAGGVTGALIGMGIPEVEARLYESHLKHGRILLTVHIDDVDELARARNVFLLADATDVVAVGEETAPPA